MTFNEKYPGETLRALSWKQPFASLMLHGKVETRVWHAPYRGLVLICASKTPYSHVEVQDIAGEEQWKRITDLLGFEFKSSDHVPLGQAIAIGRLVSSEIMDFYDSTKKGYQGVQDACFVKFQYGLWMHKYKDVQPIVPFDWHGSQGWRTVDEETKSKIILL